MGNYTISKKYSWGDAAFSGTISNTITSTRSLGAGSSGSGQNRQTFTNMESLKENNVFINKLLINYKGNVIEITTNKYFTIGYDVRSYETGVTYYASCFPKNTLVLAYKNNVLTWIKIQDIKVGTKVLSSNGKVESIIKLDTPMLGQRQMMQMDDNTLTWSEEHSFWTRDSNNNEWAWAHNKQEWLKEANEGVFGGLLDNDSIRTGIGYEFATTNGFEHKEYHVNKNYKCDVKLYYPQTKFGFIIVGNKNQQGKVVGYVVSGGINEHTNDYGNFKWDCNIVRGVK